MKLSDVQDEVVTKLKEHGGILVRLPGGLWTWPDCPKREGTAGIPAWWCGTNTVRVLIRKGIVFGSSHRSWGPVEVKLSPTKQPI